MIIPGWNTNILISKTNKKLVKRKMSIFFFLSKKKKSNKHATNSTSSFKNGWWISIVVSFSVRFSICLSFFHSLRHQLLIQFVDHHIMIGSSSEQQIVPLIDMWACVLLPVSYSCFIYSQSNFFRFFVWILCWF